MFGRVECFADLCDQVVPSSTSDLFTNNVVAHDLPTGHVIASDTSNNSNREVFEIAGKNYFLEDACCGSSNTLIPRVPEVSGLHLDDVGTTDEILVE
ncbi:hypothetical protein V6N12_051512 [Hibiscus sabdariffa]|uniref:Uncharacterized protein n=1 Tax=Hibiscus sabdariffa TaxID=183260 RepID=A0ABR2GFL5_9ROSI